MEEENWLDDEIKSRNLDTGGDWLNDEIDNNHLEATYDKMFQSSIKMTGLTGVGKSMFDEQVPFSELENLGEIRAQRQPWIAKAGAGIARVGTKAASEILKMPGVVGGALSAPFAEEGQGWETVVNNSWIKAVDNLNESVNEEVLPVYVKKAVKEGDLWANISSVDFWATEGADGAGFIASMLVPGAAIKAIGFGNKVAKGMKAMSNVNKLDDVANTVSKFKLNPDTLDLVAQTTANTIFEAAAEAKGAGDSYVMKMTEKLENGDITQEEFDAGKAEAMRNTFVANALILLGPNAVMSKMLWGRKANSKARDLFDDAGNVIAPVAKGLKTKVGDVAKDVGSALGREGFFEEGLQSTAEEMLVDRAAAGKEINSLVDLREVFSEVPEAYLDMLGTVDGQKAIFLGGFLGGGMQAFQGYKQRKSDKIATEKVYKHLEKLDSFFKLYSTDVFDEETGNINGAKMAEKLSSIAELELVSELYDRAGEQGNQEALDGLRAFATGEMVKNFIFSDDLGIDALAEYLDKSSTVEELASLEGTEREVVKKEVLDRATQLQSDYDIFRQFGDPFINLKNEEATEENRAMFYDNLSSRYVSMKNMEYHYKNSLKDKVKLKRDVLKSFGLAPELVSEDETLVEAEKNNIAIKDANSSVKRYEKLLKGLNKDINDFWKTETHQKEFDTFVGEVAKMEEAMAAQKEAEIAKTLNAIDKATTQEELDQIETASNQYADKAIKNLIKKKRQEVGTAKSTAKAQQATTQAKKTEATKSNEELLEEEDIDLAEWVANNKNVDEMVSFSMEQSPRYFTSQGIVTAVEDDYIEINALDRNEVLRMPRKKKTAATANPEQDFSTEGSNRHDELVPKNNDNAEPNEVYEEGAKVISTNRETGELFEFVDQKWRNYELEPIDKKGTPVSFGINETPGNGVEINKALKAYQAGDFSDVELLIDYLPLNAMISEDVFAPMETKPSKDGRLPRYNATSRLLRLKIINSLVAGADINNLSTTIQGQFRGALKVAPKDVNGNVVENSITDLHFLKGMKPADKVIEIQKRIGYINQRGAFETLGGDVIELNKPTAAGELYLMIPMANGQDYPLKLNIKKISETEAELLSALYKLRIQDKELGIDTRITQIKDVELVKRVKAQFAEPLKFIGKPLKDITIADLTDFLVWNKNKSMKSKIGFTGNKKKGERIFVYGNPQAGGAEINSAAEFDATAFQDWLTTNKRHQINVKPKKNTDTKADISQNRKYLSYLLDNKILNTNAVVGEDTPTFQGYANVYLDITNVAGEIKPGSEELMGHAFLDPTELDSNKTKFSKFLAAQTKKNNPTPVAPTQQTSEVESKRAEVEAKKKSNAEYDLKPLEERSVQEFNKNGEDLRRLEYELSKLDTPSQKNSQNNTGNIRNSQKKVVPLQQEFIPIGEVNYSGKKINLDKFKKDSISTDKMSDEVTAKVVTALFTTLKDNNLIKLGRSYTVLMQGTNQEKFVKLKALAEKHDLAVEKIILNCKNGL